METRIAQKSWLSELVQNVLLYLLSVCCKGVCNQQTNEQNASNLCRHGRKLHIWCGNSIKWSHLFLLSQWYANNAFLPPSPTIYLGRHPRIVSRNLYQHSWNNKCVHVGHREWVFPLHLRKSCCVTYAWKMGFTLETSEILFGYIDIYIKCGCVSFQPLSTAICERHRK